MKSGGDWGGPGDRSFDSTPSRLAIGWLMNSAHEKHGEKIGRAWRDGGKAAAQAGRMVSRITKRYLLLVALFAALSLADYVVALQYLDTTVEDSAVLNISGRQRMLSQRAAMLAGHLTEARDRRERELLRDEILDIAGAMERGHLGLIRGDPELNLPRRLSAGLNAHYFGEPSHLDVRLRAYLAEIRALADAPFAELVHPDPRAARIMASAMELLPYLDQAVRLYQADIDSEVARQMAYRTAWILGILGLLLFFAQGVFRPLARRIERTVGESAAAAAALAESEAKYRGLIEGSVQGIVIVRDLRMVFVNQSAANILGYASPEALSQVESWLNVVAPEERARIMEYSLSRRRGMPAPEQYEHRALRRDGTEAWLGTQVRTIDWEGTHAVQITLVDVTERRMAQKNLQMALEDAEVANRAKSDFLANISHELRTPLNAIIGFSEIMQLKIHGELGDKYQGYANDINESGQHLLSLINDIIDLSKIEAGKYTLHEADVDLTETIAACMRIVGERAREGGLNLTERIARDLPCLHADERALKQILLNLLSNAVKFTPRGGAITIEAVRTAGGSIRISVADTGIGLDAEQIATAWSSFGQVESAMVRTHVGAGLGLPIVRSLIDLHGGTVELDSEPGIGTIVTMEFPPARTIVSRTARESSAA